MTTSIVRAFSRRAALSASMLLLGVVACSSATAPTGNALPTASRAVGSASQLTQPTELATLSKITPSTASPTERTTPTPTPTPFPATATATASPEPTPAPTHSPTPTPSATATPTPELRRLTTGSCCTQPFWSPDSQKVLFIDKPNPDAPLGIWGVNTTQPGTEPELLTQRIAFYTADLTYLITRDQGQTVIERLASPLSETAVEGWIVPSEGRLVSISPGRSRIAWEVSNENLPFERRTSQVWVANLDGLQAQLVATLPRGGFVGWLSNDVLLLIGRESLESQESVVFSLSLLDGATIELARAERPRGLSLSPDGEWLAYFVSLSDEPEDNGFWVVRTDGSEQRQVNPQLFGAFQWRDAHRLIVIPFRPDAAFHEIWELDVGTGAVRRLTDPSVTPFKIANGDWRVSPDGHQVAFVESEDRNIWVLTLLE